MPKADPTFELIKHLTKTEKRYFRLQGLSASPGEKQYLKLFDKLDKGKRYEVGELKKLFKNDLEGKKFSAAKKYLHQQILSALVVFHRNDNIENRFYTLLGHYRILHQKGLYRQAEAVLTKCRKLADKSFDLVHTFTILNLERNLITHNQSQQTKHLTLLKKTGEKADMAREIWIESQLLHIHSQLHLMLNRQGTIKSEADAALLESLIKDEAIEEAENSTHLRNSITLHNIWNQYYWLTQQYLKSYEHSKRVLNIHSANEAYKRRNPRSYIASVQNFCMRCIHHNKFEEAFQTVNKLKTFEPVNATEESIAFECYFIIRFLLCRKSGLLLHEEKLVEQFSQGLEKVGAVINKSFELYLYGQVSVYEFLGGKYGEALEWLNKYLVMGESDFYWIDKPVAEIYRLVIFYEMGEPALLASSLESARTHINKQNSYPQFTAAMLNFFSASLKINDAGEKRTQFAALTEKLKETDTVPEEKPAFGLFDFIDWSEAKSEGKLMIELLQVG